MRSNLNIFHISHKFVDKQQALKIPWQYLYISRKKRSNVLYEMLKLYLWINSTISDISKNFILTAIIQHQYTRDRNILIIHSTWYYNTKLCLFDNMECSKLINYNINGRYTVDLLFISCWGNITNYPFLYLLFVCFLTVLYSIILVQWL